MNNFLAILGWALVALIVIIAFFKREKIINFMREVKVELLKATWPWDPKEKGFAAKYKELIDSTVVVIIAMILLSAYVAMLDFSLIGLTRFLTK